MKASIFLTGLALVAVISLASAQNPTGRRGNGNGNGKCSVYADNNKDGVCDNYGTRTATARGKKGSGNCNGTGMGKGQKQGKGANFVDADKDGVCDTYQTRTKSK
ncbi:MAG: hypothetical protein JNL03_02580 [Prolixibacteraceae bacterium]|nr:hypothetical protein [Prolixibacteraceae bacterium]